jgi:hypothetical protein
MFQDVAYPSMLYTAALTLNVSAVAVLNVNDANAVQQESAATLPSGTDPRRPTKATDLRQRPVMPSCH